MFRSTFTQTPSISHQSKDTHNTAHLMKLCSLTPQVEWEEIKGADVRGELFGVVSGFVQVNVYTGHQVYHTRARALATHSDLGK